MVWFAFAPSPASFPHQIDGAQATPSRIDGSTRAFASVTAGRDEYQWNKYLGRPDFIRGYNRDDVDAFKAIMAEQTDREAHKAAWGGGFEPSSRDTPTEPKTKAQQEKDAVRAYELVYAAMGA